MRSIFLILLGSAAGCSSAFGWGCEGHQMVAMIARGHLAPAVSAAVDDLLKAGPIDPALRRFCQDRPADPMADSSTWADDSKGPEKTAVWHYVDIPRSVSVRSALDAWCPPVGPSVDGKNRPGCITNALEYEIGILRDRSAPAAERATALRYTIHFVGDIHQPLHDEDNNDQGGNCTAIQFFADDRPSNLHAIWDYRLIQRDLETRKMTQAEYAGRLDQEFASDFTAVSAARPNDPETWAWDTHAVSETAVYGNLKPGIPVETPNPQAVCNAERDKVQALHIVVNDQYMNQAMPAIDRQLALAGFRLARLLNDLMQ
jgi:hypothetical protein